jgi:transposase
MSGKIGIDVSKLKLDVAWLMDNGKYRTKVLSNDLAGFKALVVWIQANVAPTSDAVHVCMEATGAYHEALALHLHDYGLHHAGLCVSVVNPIIVKRFLECDKVRNKTDGGDAKGLARFCLEKAPEPWEAPTPGVRALQALVLRLHTVELMRQGELNRLATAHASVRASIQAVIANLDEAITQVRAQIKATIDDDPDLKGRQALLHTIPGLGDKSIPQLLAFIGKPERFRTVKALIAYASLSPLVRQSGTSLNKQRGTHPMGNRDLKNALYFPAMVAGRFNPLVAKFWNHLKAQHKPGLVIVVACMHKLLAIIYGVLKSKKPFDPDYLKPKST